MRSTFSATSTNYAISLWVAGMALAWRARAALLKGASLGLLGVWVIGTAGWHAWADARRRPRSWVSSACWPCSPMPAWR